MNERVTDSQTQRFSEYVSGMCTRSGHSWDVIETMANGPEAVICGHCGKNSGLVRPSPVGETSVTFTGEAEG